ncbi:MarR family transcriptional regulator [Kitasatospora sp. GP82]|uniref:GbsR/MarR family transcriptional regulator n=1 Tax=Kitasatospora sp. GP82 TaxID=3035089 RepID=UPI002474D662|nr:MarR family transcriptional regulator [Kitasatospora sp. GP82]
MPHERGRDERAVSTFVERFANVLTDSGIPRMPARIFAALLATDSGRLTAAGLSEALQVSPAAVSGGVRYLEQVNLVSRERDPGSRRDRFRVHDDVWYEASVRRDQMLVRWESSLQEGIAALGADSPAGARMAESLAFFEFLRGELAGIQTRWQAHRAALRAAREQEG